jgi:hypothetical protein
LEPSARARRADRIHPILRARRRNRPAAGGKRPLDKKPRGGTTINCAAVF